MLRLDTGQATRIAQQQFVHKLLASLARNVPEFAALPPEDRLQCLAESLDAAGACGLRGEQGLAAYALAAAFIGPGFEAASAVLRAVLAGPLPEARRVHALNAWVLAAAGAPGNVTAADAALNTALQHTAALGAG
jgi:hypothetical protein